MLEIMHPDTAENPFSDEAIRLRNYIILLLGLDMGLRRSEMLLIKTSDIHWHSRQLAVVNLEDEGLDPRTMAPQFKTNERMLVMTDDLYDAITEYESKYRNRKPRSGASLARRHPFLLVAHKRNEGGPLTIKAVDGVLSRVREIAPELAHVHPHLLRHDAVYTMLESMREELAVLTPEDRTAQVQKTLTWMFGWSPDSNMPGHYGANSGRKRQTKQYRNGPSGLRPAVRKQTRHEEAHSEHSRRSTSGTKGEHSRCVAEHASPGEMWGGVHAR